MTTSHLGNDEALSLLRWQRDMGVTAAISDVPRNWLAEEAKRRADYANSTPSKNESSPPPIAPQVAQQPSVEQTDKLAEDAEKLAKGATDLEQLKETLEAFQGCPLKLRATQLVFADGNPESDIMLIGEAPGRDEDLQGKPFVGRSGQLLDRMLAAIGLDRTSVYIANTVPWRPPGNRTPTGGEIATCLPFLNRQIELVAPKLIVTLGAAATQTMRSEPKLSIVRERGKWATLTINGQEIPTLAMFHPAFLLRQPAKKREAWKDLLSLQKKLDTD